MEVSQNNGIQADSIAQQTGTLMLQRATLDFSGADAFRIDSSRIQVKKPSAPIIKTIPYVPENDTINHPVYDVLNGEFVINPDESLISHLHLNPIEPVNSNNQEIVAVSPQQKVKQGGAEVLRQVKSAPSSELLTDNTASKPAEVVPADTISLVAAADTNIAVADSLIATDSLSVADSIVIVDTASQQNAGRKIFEEKEGKPLVRKPYGFSIDKTASDTDWMLGVIITSFIFFAWARMIYGKFVGMVFQAAVNFFAANRIFNEQNVVRGRVFALLNLLFYINTSLFICQSTNFFGISIVDYSGWWQFCICALALIAFFSAKTILLKMLEFVFENEAFGIYNFSIYLFNKVYGMIMMPFVAAIPFVPDVVTEKLIWIGVSLFVLMYVLTLFRGLRICLRKGVSLFYLFFYLCALEILPALTIYKCILKYLL